MIIYYNTEFAGGRSESRRLLERAFAVHTGDPHLAAELISDLKTGNMGKPYTDGFCHFSVSHTGSLWAVLVCEAECGLDIQLERDCDMQAVASRVFAADDRDALAREIGGQSPCSDAATDLFFRIWTRREALAKAMGGSAFESSMPPVLHEPDPGEPHSYRIDDIPAAEAMLGVERAFDGKKLYAAVCVMGEDITDTETEFVRI